MNRRTLALLATALLLTACVEDTRPDAEACTAQTIQIELGVSAEALEPADPSVCRGQEVTMVLRPTVDGVFHIHGYDDQVPATEISSGEAITLAFSAARSGRFPIELHATDDPEGAEIGFFTVHEP